MGMRETITELEKKLADSEATNADLQATVKDYEKMHDKKVPKKVLEDHEAALEEKDSLIADAESALTQANERNQSLQAQADALQQELDQEKAKVLNAEKNKGANALTPLTDEELEKIDAERDAAMAKLLEERGLMDWRVVAGDTGLISLPDGDVLSMTTLAKDIGGFGTPGVRTITIIDDNPPAVAVHRDMKLVITHDEGRKVFELVSA